MTRHAIHNWQPPVSAPDLYVGDGWWGSTVWLVRADNPPPGAREKPLGRVVEKYAARLPGEPLVLGRARFGKGGLLGLRVVDDYGLNPVLFHFADALVQPDEWRWVAGSPPCALAVRDGEPVAIVAPLRWEAEDG